MRSLLAVIVLPVRHAWRAVWRAVAKRMLPRWMNANALAKAQDQRGARPLRRRCIDAASFSTSVRRTSLIRRSSMYSCVSSTPLPMISAHAADELPALSHAVRRTRLGALLDRGAGARSSARTWMR